MILKNAYILDGTGAPGYLGDIAIDRGKILKIGRGLSGGKSLVDVRGLAVSPGWIDSHSHSDNAMISWPDMRQKIEQGITFSVAGQCGFSPAPTQTETFDSFFGKLGAQGSGAGVLVGYNTLRSFVMGNRNQEPTATQQAQMENLLEQSLEQGAMGMSLGLYYTPGCYARTQELVCLARIVAAHNKILTCHIRDEADALVDAVGEFISVVQAAGCRGVISHHKAAWAKNWGKVKTTLDMIDKANAQGADIYLDVYPYTASATQLIARFVPSQFHPPGLTDRMTLLEDPEIRQKICNWGREKWGNDLSWTLVSSCEGYPEYEGKNINEIAVAMDQPDRMEAALQLLIQSRGQASGFFFMMCPEDVQRVMQHPRAMLCTDSSVAKDAKLYHPRLGASFPRALGHYVRELEAVSLPEMIRKMTGLPAQVYGLHSKGRIAPGMDADLCVFDPETIAGPADYTHCDLPNRGLQYVFIDGKCVLENGVYNGTRAAKVYRF